MKPLRKLHRETEYEQREFLNTIQTQKGNETIFIYKYFRGYPQNMSGPYGNNQGGYGAPGNPYGQGSNPPQGGNPYTQSGPGGYPPSGQQPYGSNPYTQNPGSSGSGYPSSQGGGYPPQSGAYPPQGGSGYPPQGGSGYPPQGGGYPPQGGGYPNQGPSGFGGPGMGASPGGFAPNDPRAQHLNQIIQRHEINPQFAARLQALGNCEIVVLCDDSGSMNTPLQNSNQTRWDELRQVRHFFSVF